MYHPNCGGARGGAAEFSWETVKASKDREFYLGNSVAAPTGRWQDGRDINWYNKDAASSSRVGQSSSADLERRAELRAIKVAEEEALYAKLGRKPPSRDASLGQLLTSGSTTYVANRSTGANSAPIAAVKSRTWQSTEHDGITEDDRALARKLAKEHVKIVTRQHRHEEKERVREERRRRRDQSFDGDRPLRSEHMNGRYARQKEGRHHRSNRRDHVAERRSDTDIPRERRPRSLSRSP